MAKDTEIRAILNELNLTEEDMDRLWQELIDFGYNKTVLALNRSGVSWKGLNAAVIKTIPGQLEKDKRAKEKAEQKAKAIDISNMEVVANSLEQKVLTGRHLTETEIKELVNEYEVETIDGDDNRWTRNVRTIVKVQDRFFAIDWQRGLTECQEDCYLDQPIEVRKHTYPQTIMVTEWLEV